MFSLGLVSLLAILAQGCAPEEFEISFVDAEQDAPGGFVIPPKVDILVVEDDTGSMHELYQQVAAQVPEFAQKLSAQDWDFHLATIPLTQARNINQVMASKFDGNYAVSGLGWVQPFPGAKAEDHSVPAVTFRTADNYSDFLRPSDVSSSLGTLEPGLDNIIASLNSSSMASSGFLRNDALLIVLIIGNGNDTSGVTLCTRNDGLTYPCPGSGTDSHVQSLQSLVSSGKSADVRVYAAVATQSREYTSGNCQGSQSKRGDRYMEVARATGGQSYNVCETSLSTILDAISSHLEVQRQDFRTRYLVLAEEPDPESITVTKIIAGNENDRLVLQQGTEWEYKGYGTAHLIDYPIPMNENTGYLIELKGQGRLEGSDKAHIEYKPIGG